MLSQSRWSQCLILKPILIDFSDAASGFKIKVMVESLDYTILLQKPFMPCRKMEWNTIDITEEHTIYFCYFEIWVPRKDIHVINLLQYISHCSLVTLRNLKN